MGSSFAFIYWNPICTLIVWLTVWLGHLPWNNNVLGVFWWNIGPSKVFICWNPTCSFLWEVVQIFDHQFAVNCYNMLGAFSRVKYGTSFTFTYWYPTCTWLVRSSPEFVICRELITCWAEFGRIWHLIHIYLLISHLHFCLLRYFHNNTWHYLFKLKKI